MLIPCSFDCVHQSDGRCHLGRAAAMNSCDERFCAYQQRQPTEIRLPHNLSEIVLPPSESTMPQEPRQLL